MAASKAFDIVVLCENVLGWSPKKIGPKGMRYERQLAAWELQKKLDTSDLFTLHNLELAVEWSRKRREGVSHPLTLFYRIPLALEDALEVAPEPTELELQVTEALVWEREHPDGESDRWIGQFQRAAGNGRGALLAEWKGTRGGNMS